jgi:hypothetical protein
MECVRVEKATTTTTLQRGKTQKRLPFFSRTFNPSNGNRVAEVPRITNSGNSNPNTDSE